MGVGVVRDIEVGQRCEGDLLCVCRCRASFGRAIHDHVRLTLLVLSQPEEDDVAQSDPHLRPGSA